jgi:hypothetical protein
MQLSAAAGSANGLVYAFGGFIPGAGAQGPTFAYSPTLDSWTSAGLASMPTPRDQAPAVLVSPNSTMDSNGTMDPAVYVLGGAIQCHCQALAVNQRYTPSLPPLPPELAINVHLDTPADACHSVRYTITVTNSGQQPASGAVVQDLFPSSLHDLTWICSRQSTGAHCTPASAGVTDHITDHVDLPAGGSVTYQVSATLDPAATGALADTASVTSAAGQSEQSTARAPITSCAILVSKTADTPAAQPTGALGFTIVVTNRALTGIAIDLADDLTAGGLTATAWCQGAGCTPLPAASLISHLPSVPPAGTVTFQVSGIVPCGAQAITNTACASGPDGVLHCAMSSVPVTLSYADLEAQEIAPATVTAGSTALFLMETVNLGPCPADDVMLSATLPAGFTPVGPLPGSCVMVGATVRCRLGRLIRNGTALVELTAAALCSLPAGPAESTFRVHSPTPDHNRDNNQATGSTQIEVHADYQITKQGALVPAPEPGPKVAGGPSTLTYTLQATNLGPSCPPGVLVEDAFPAVIGWQWCVGEGCQPATRGNLSYLLSLLPQASETFLASVTLPPLYSGTVCNTAQVSPPPGVDLNLGNNAATACVTLPVSPVCPDGCPVPALSPAALVLLAVLLPALALARLRRRARHRRR